MHAHTLYCTVALLVGHNDLTGVDGLNDVVRGTAVDGAADGLSGTEDLLNTTSEVLGHGLVGHLAGNLKGQLFMGLWLAHVVDLVEGNVSSVLDVLLLLAVTDRLLEGLDDKGGSRGDDRDGGLTVLDGELDGDTESLPVASGLGNVLSNLLGGLFVSSCTRRCDGMSFGCNCRTAKQETVSGKKWTSQSSWIRSHSDGHSIPLLASMSRTLPADCSEMSIPSLLTRPRGPILGARAEEAPTSPPVARR